jgi:hypothetical protein
MYCCINQPCEKQKHRLFYAVRERQKPSTGLEPPKILTYQKTGELRIPPILAERVHRAANREPALGQPKSRETQNLGIKDERMLNKEACQRAKAGGSAPSLRLPFFFARAKSGIRKT